MNEKKTQKSRFSLNMDCFYLASELPWGENCHVLAIDVLQFWGNPSPAKQEDGVYPKVQSCRGQTVWLSLRYGGVHQHQSKDSNPQGPRRPLLVLPQQQVSPQTKALLNDKNHKKEKEKKKKTCTGWWLLACCIIIMFWYTETDAERKATGRRRMRHMIGMIVASFPIILPHLSINKTSVRRRWIQIQVRD